MENRDGILFLLRYLIETTDEAHPADSIKLKELMGRMGYSSDPRTIRKSVNMMREAGYDIVINERNGVPTQYFYSGQEWDRTELRILIDAVSSTQFLSPARSRKIIGKLASLAGNQYRKELTPSVFVSERVKAANNQILYILEKIGEAIREKKKISFKYYNYNAKKERIQRHGGETYVLSPYATIWKEDRYYVVGFSDKRQDIVTFRIDRMPIPTILEEDAQPRPKSFRIQDYAEKFTRMYGGKEETVTLRCRMGMMDQIIDKFGLDVRVSNVTPYTFDVTATVAVGGTFLSWVFQYAGSIVITGPESVREMYREMLDTARNDIRDGDFSVVSERVWKL